MDINGFFVQRLSLKGYTIFEIKDLATEKKDDSQRESAGISSGLGDRQSVHVEGGLTADGYVQNPSALRYGPTSHLRDPTPLNVTVNANVVNNVGGAVSATSLASKEEDGSSFEFVTP